MLTAEEIEEAACGICGASFAPNPEYVRQGCGKYCSKACRYKAASITRAQRHDPIKSATARLDKNVDRSGGPDACWPWTGKTDIGGYGRLRVNDRQAQAHRFAYEISRGTIPPGLCVCHRCDNPACCNPAHLWLGTDADNMADRHAKGRYATGANHFATALTEEQVIDIRRRAAAGEQYVELAREFGVHKQTIASAARGKTWGDLSSEPSIGKWKGRSTEDEVLRALQTGASFTFPDLADAIAGPEHDAIKNDRRICAFRQVVRRLRSRGYPIELMRRGQRKPYEIRFMSNEAGA